MGSRLPTHPPSAPALARAGVSVHSSVSPEALGHGPAEDGWAQERCDTHRVKGPPEV